MKLRTSILALLIVSGSSFSPISRVSSSPTRLLAAPVDSDFEKATPVANDGVVDPNVYNVNAETAADLWTVSVSPEKNADREAGIPFLDSKSKDYFVDDEQVVISRDGGMGLELLELAGGRDDDFGLTIVSGVSGNAQAAGVLAGDSIASVQVQLSSVQGTNVQETLQNFECECKNFDTTIGLLGSFPPEIDSLVLNLKRIRRWPKVKVVVEYPPSQCAEGADNKETVELFAGENLRRALLNRGIVMEDRDGRKCDFCGGKCTVKIDMGMQLMNPMSTTEEKLMKNNPKCRVSLVGKNVPALFCYCLSSPSIFRSRARLLWDTTCKKAM
jgi:hypothetical protein